MFEIVIQFWCRDTVRAVTDSPAETIALYMPKSIRHIECITLTD